MRISDWSSDVCSSDLLWFFVLCMRVVVARGQLGINLGDGGNETMNRRIRGHANFVEYVPLCLLLIAILELSHFSIYLIHALGQIGRASCRERVCHSV